MSPVPVPVDIPDDVDAMVRLLAIAFRRYVREPESRAASARMIADMALRLLAENASAGEAALAASETIAALAQAERRRRR